MDVSRPVPLSRFALSFGHVASTYDRMRPEWPAEAVDRAAEALELTSGATVVDLAAGTGKLTRRLVERFARVFAVEPDDGMRTALEAGTRDADVLAGAAESIPLGAGSADAVFVGDAFHWFDARAALAEIARVLRPRGGLALLWNQWWAVEPPIPGEAHSVIEEVYERTGRAALLGDTDDWPAAFADSPFEPLREETFERELRLTPDEVAELYSTVSGVASLGAEERAEVTQRLRAVLSGRYRLPVKTELYWTRLR